MAMCMQSMAGIGALWAPFMAKFGPLCRGRAVVDQKFSKGAAGGGYSKSCVFTRDAALRCPRGQVVDTKTPRGFRIHHLGPGFKNARFFSGKISGPRHRGPDKEDQIWPRAGPTGHQSQPYFACTKPYFRATFWACFWPPGPPKMDRKWSKTGPATWPKKGQESCCQAVVVYISWVPN